MTELLKFPSRPESPGTDDESPLDYFQSVDSLVSLDRKIVIAPPDMRVSDALQIMHANSFNQLPVCAGDIVIGIFSYRSFARRVAELAPLGGKQSIGDLPVDEFMEQPECVQFGDTFDRLLAPLDEHDVVLVGNARQLQGIVTPMDMLRGLYGFTRFFIVLSEIELALRSIIRHSVTDTELEQCIKVTLQPDPVGNLPSTLEDMTLGEYVRIIEDGRNWSHFEAAFGAGAWQRSQTATKLKEVRDLRNDAFHFKRKLTDQDFRRLSGHRQWLFAKATAFQAKKGQSNA